jgi:hypothetical protein
MADLSRSAQQILDEAWGSPWEADDLDLADVEVIVAYALRAAALYCTRDHLILLALAEELEGRAALAQPEIEPDEPAVPDGREPASVTDQPTDKELLELMPETMRDEFSYAAKVCSDATGGQVKPGIFRVCLNHSALEYARAVLARWGNQ